MQTRSALGYLRLLPWVGLGSLPPLIGTVFLVQHVVFGNSIGGLQYSDAGGWADCARSIAAFNLLPDLGGDWCMRRPATPYVVGGLMSLLGSLHLTLIALSFVMGFSWVWMIYEAKRFAGILLAAAIGLIVLPLWMLWGMNQVLSETLALPLACVAAAALLRGLSTGVNQWHLVAVAAIAWAEQFRPANLLMLVAPVLFAAAVRELRWQRLIASAALTVTPYCVVWIRSHSLGYRETGQGGNGWATVYGLVTGNRSWAVAVTDIGGYATAPDESTRWRLVRDATLQAFAAEPMQAFKSLFLNIWSLSTNAWLVVGMGTLALVAATVLSAGYWMKLAAGLRQSGSKPLTLAVTLATLSTLAVWAIILPAGLEGLRVMSTAIPTLAALHVVALKKQSASGQLPNLTVGRSSGVLAVSLALPVILGILSLAPWSAAKVETFVNCPPGFLWLEKSTLQSVRTADLRIVTTRFAPDGALKYLDRPHVTLVEGVAVSSTGKVIPLRYSTTRRDSQPKCIPHTQMARATGFTFPTLQYGTQRQN